MLLSGIRIRGGDNNVRRSCRYCEFASRCCCLISVLPGGASPSPTAGRGSAGLHGGGDGGRATLLSSSGRNTLDDASPCTGEAFGLPRTAAPTGGPFLRRGGGLPRPAANRSVNENGAANSYRLRIRRTVLAVKDGYRREGQGPPLRTLKKNVHFPRKGLDKYIGRRYIGITI